MKLGTVSFDEFFGFQFSESKIIKRNDFRFKLCNLSKKFLQRKSIDALSAKKMNVDIWIKDDAMRLENHERGQTNHLNRS